MSQPEDPERIAVLLAAAVAASRAVHDGAPASYIPELANVDLDLVSAAVTTVEGQLLTAGDVERHRFTWQSSAKLILLSGLLEELGEERVFSVVGAEPSGSSFASIARLETHGPHPANPLVNAGAIALCSIIPGDLGAKLTWIEGWAERLAGTRLAVHHRVLDSERRTGDRNRAIAWLLKSSGALASDPQETLEAYFFLCSLEADVRAASHLAGVLASGGLAPGRLNTRLLARRTAGSVVALMATCGMYDESGGHLLATGLPAKSGVSGIILAVATGRAGIAVASPRVNSKGGSVRGHLILRRLVGDLDWHFAL